MALLEVSELAVTFNTPKGPVYAVSDVSFSVDKGDALGIVGESGSGKSVTVKSLMGLLPRSANIAGRAVYDDLDVFNLPRDRRKHFYGVDIAMVFQNPMTSLNPVKRIGEQLMEGMRFHRGLSRSAAKTRAVELLDLVRIPDSSKRLRQYPHELSGGMRQRVVIAMALANDPALLIADEPTTALDVTVQRDILDLLDGLRRDLDMALILITHDLGVVRDRTDTIAVMYGGRVMEAASTEEVFADTEHPYTQALQRAIPDMSMPRGTRLDPIPGSPPDLGNAPTSCPFAPRCNYVTDRCTTTVPPLEVAANSETHRYACFHPQGLAAGAVAAGGDR
ncbi:MAG: peptide/nickel transport system ATP-binding protein [Verrucomicrobiales bacterium]|jgi:peptide/nickel transport system ATP-binding protein